MFDIGPSELLLIVIVAVIAIGPKELPGALRAAGRWIGQEGPTEIFGNAEGCHQNEQKRNGRDDRASDDLRSHQWLLWPRALG